MSGRGQRMINLIRGLGNHATTRHLQSELKRDGDYSTAYKMTQAISEAREILRAQEKREGIVCFKNQSNPSLSRYMIYKITARKRA